MGKCKNPECNNDLPDNLNYCNEECLKMHLEQKKKQKEEKLIQTPIKFLKITIEEQHEIRKIYETFGFSHDDGSIIGKHNTIILSYLIHEKEGIYNTTVDRLTWMSHMSNRALKENYLKGIESFGIIETFPTEFGVLKWRWVGIKALSNNGDGK